jgi:pimeloyl-ACP methyl ester carboxylesterase
MNQHKIKGLNVIEHGNPQNQSVIFVHAFPLCNRMWDPQAEALKENYRVIVYDNRSFGYSDTDTGSLTIDSHVDDLFSIMSELNLNRPVLCGLSMGGYIALRALELNQKMFRAVILCDTRSFADDNSGIIKRAEQIKQIKSGGRKEFDEAFLKNTLCPKTLEGNEEKQKTVNFIREIMSWQKDDAVTGALLTMAARTDTTEFLENITLPAIVIIGEDDKLTPASPSRLMNAKIRNSSMKIIPEAGHFPNLENTKAFNEAIINFLNNLKN